MRQKTEGELTALSGWGAEASHLVVVCLCMLPVVSAMSRARQGRLGARVCVYMCVFIFMCVCVCSKPLTIGRETNTT